MSEDVMFPFDSRVSRIQTIYLLPYKYTNRSSGPGLSLSDIHQ